MDCADEFFYHTPAGGRQKEAPPRLHSANFAVDQVVEELMNWMK